MGDLIPFLAISLLFGVIPITAIVSGVYLKSLRIRSQQNNGFYEEDLQELRRLAAENDTLRQRIENLEAIVVDKDASMLQGLKDVDTSSTAPVEQRKISYKDADIEF